MLEHFKFLKGHTKVMPKMTIPSPGVMHFRLEPRCGEPRRLSESRRHLRRPRDSPITRRCRAFYDAGCRYLQLDDTAWAYLCSQSELQKARDRGLDVDHLQETYAACINKALAAKPADMTITIAYLPRQFPLDLDLVGRLRAGRRESCSATLNYDGYFMEYDTDRAGGFEPLRFLPKGKKRVVLGLVTSKTRAAGAREDIKRRIEEATKYRRARSALPVAAMRLRLDRRGQCAGRGRAVGEARAWWSRWPRRFGAAELSRPPLAGEGGEHASRMRAHSTVTAPGCSLTLAATLPFQRERSEKNRE